VPGQARGYAARGMAQVRHERMTQPVEVQDPAPVIDVGHASRLKVLLEAFPPSGRSICCRCRGKALPVGSLPLRWRLRASARSSRSGTGSVSRCLLYPARTRTVSPSRSKSPAVRVRASFARKPVSAQKQYSRLLSAPAIP
jgi:hypothetical protein